MGLGVALGCKVNGPVVITDQKNMVDLMKKNIALNSLDSRVKELVLNWYDYPFTITYFPINFTSGVVLYPRKF